MKRGRVATALKKTKVPEKIVFNAKNSCDFDLSYFLLFLDLLLKLERALRALASSSGGAACPRGQGDWGEGSTLEVGGDPKVI